MKILIKDSTQVEKYVEELGFRYDNEFNILLKECKTIEELDLCVENLEYEIKKDIMANYPLYYSIICNMLGLSVIEMINL